MRQFARDHPPGDDADDFPARGEGGISHNAHQPDIPAAVHQRQAALGEDSAAFPGRSGIFRQRAGTGTAKDAYPFHARRTVMASPRRMLPEQMTSASTPCRSFIISACKPGHTASIFGQGFRGS